MVGTKTTKTVTVERRGAFTDDPFFKDSLEEWDQAMKNVVDRWDKQPVTTTTTTTTSPSSSETRTVYRQIRSSNVTSDDSQAVSCTEEDGKYKMIIDVKDFKPEDINVKTVDDTVVVEGKIEKKEGNAVSTQMFTRRFMLPSNVDLNAITSALSRDGVLTINAPKLATQGAKGRLTSPSSKNGTTTITTSTINPLAFGSSIGKTAGNDKRYLNHTPLHDEPPSQTTTIVRTEVDRGSRDHWTSFNDMVEKSQREMEDMMRRHTLNSSLDSPTSPPSVSTNLTISTQPSSRPPAGVATNRDVVKSGNNVTEREEQRWEDNPAPGLTRHNRVLNEKTAMKGADGSVIGNKERMEKESHAEGSNEEVLPDGTKRKTFTKSYETRKVYSFNSGDPKAV
ncbi:heat shock protein 67B1-like [Penaeus indicus]|uniref:heat shock protein 67B1-like n=1 Tax=Penaeus indicus TaxID=29960 RepID=UPI00300C61E5